MTVQIFDVIVVAVLVISACCRHGPLFEHDGTIRMPPQYGTRRFQRNDLAGIKPFENLEYGHACEPADATQPILTPPQWIGEFSQV